MDILATLTTKKKGLAEQRGPIDAGCVPRCADRGIQAQASAVIPRTWRHNSVEFNIFCVALCQLWVVGFPVALIFFFMLF